MRTRAGSRTRAREGHPCDFFFFLIYDFTVYSVLSFPTPHSLFVEVLSLVTS
jgi:hypothetical protein